MKITILALTLLCFGIVKCAKIGVGTRTNKSEIKNRNAPSSRRAPHTNKEEVEIKTKDERETDEVPVFRNDYTYMKEFKTFVKLNDNPKPWADARQYCEYEGASLAVIVDEDEAKVMAAMVKQLHLHHHTGVWVGLHDLFSEGEFVTIKGEPMDSPNVYNEWAKNEPNNVNGSEHCVMFYRDEKLNDVNCDKHYPFLCKRDAENLKFNSECNTTVPEYKLTPDGEQCFKLHTESKTWRDAFITCLAEEGNLAILNSEEEVKLYTDVFETIPTYLIDENTHKDAVLVGFHELFKENEYLAIDGKTLKEVGFDRWANGQPDNPETEKCGSLLRSGELNDIDCDTKAMFVCEKKSGKQKDDHHEDHDKSHETEKHVKRKSTSSKH